MTPLNRAERWTVYVGLGAAVWTLLAFVATPVTSIIMVMLLFSIIGMPLAWLLMQLPTLALYLLAAAPLYLLLRRWSRVVASIVALGATITASTLVAKAANQRAEAEVDAFVAQDRGGPLALPNGVRVAHLYSWGKHFDWNVGCEDHCQRLLFSGAAREVLRGDLEAMDGRASLKRYWLAPTQGPCGRQRVTPARADEQDVGANFFPRPLLSEWLDKANAEGRCLMEADATIGQADIILYDQFEPVLRPQRGLDLRMGGLSRMERKAIYRVTDKGLVTLMQKSGAEAPRLAVPLQIEPPFVFDTHSGGHWRRDGGYRRGEGYTAYLREFVTNDLAVRGLGETVVWARR